VAHSGPVPDERHPDVTDPDHPDPLERPDDRRRPIVDSHGTTVGYDIDAQDAAAREHGLEL
jgi:hypothetical protein